MIERDEEFLTYHRHLAEMTLAQSGEDRAKLNERAKKAIAALREEFSTADDDALIDFLTNMSYMLAKLMNTKTADLVDLMDHMFVNAVLAAASLLGQYDLEDSTPGRSAEEIIEEAKAERAKEFKHAAEDAGLESSMTDEEWAARLAKQYL